MAELQEIQAQMIAVSKLHQNKGQVEGLPKNPRFIKDEKFTKLVNSLREDPEMMNLREVIAYDNNGELVVIGGNMRLRAAKELGWKELPCKVLPSDTSVEKLKAYAIKDNASFGENDWDLLANEWDEVSLEDWGVDLPVWDEQDEDYDEQEKVSLGESGGKMKSITIGICKLFLTEEEISLVENSVAEYVEKYGIQFGWFSYIIGNENK